jgi:glycosyltransferase involved in cell wall biosynthesis
VLGPRRAALSVPPLDVLVHRSRTSGPHWRDWGDDWSWSLGHSLARLGPADVVVLHLNSYAAARLAHRSAWRSRVVIVFHGMGVGAVDDHLSSADGLVVLREEAAHRLCREGAEPGRVSLMAPSVERNLFFGADDDVFPDAAPVLGFVGRVEQAKGAFEIPDLVHALLERGHDVRAELVGPVRRAGRRCLAEAIARTGTGERIELLGPLPAKDVGARMRGWRLLLLPSYTEGHPIVALEAAACRLPVAAIAGVMPAELERRPSIRVGRRDDYVSAVDGLLKERRRPPPADWVSSHEEGAQDWDAMLTALTPWCERRRPAASRLPLARLRPVRRVVRVARRCQRVGG